MPRPKSRPRRSLRLENLEDRTTPANVWMGSVPFDDTAAEGGGK
jgi:hypothetical protein